MVEFGVIQKDGTALRFKIEKLEILMMSEGTGNVWLNLGKPLEMKIKVLTSRNKLPSVFTDFVNAWTPEDIEKVSKMSTDEEMMKDMIDDFLLEGHEVIVDDGGV